MIKFTVVQKQDGYLITSIVLNDKELTNFGYYISSLSDIEKAIEEIRKVYEQ